MSELKYLGVLVLVVVGAALASSEFLTRAPKGSAGGATSPTKTPAMQEPPPSQVASESKRDEAEPDRPTPEPPTQPYTWEKLDLDVARVNVRAGPGTEHRVIGQLENDASVGLLAEDGGWKHIVSGELQGWILGRFAVRNTRQMRVDHAKGLEWLLLEAGINATVRARGAKRSRLVVTTNYVDRLEAHTLPKVVSFDTLEDLGFERVFLQESDGSGFNWKLEPVGSVPVTRGVVRAEDRDKGVAASREQQPRVPPAPCTPQRAALRMTRSGEIRNGLGAEHGIAFRAPAGHGLVAHERCGDWFRVETDYRRSGQLVTVHGFVRADRTCQQGDPGLSDRVRPPCG